MALPPRTGENSIVSISDLSVLPEHAAAAERSARVAVFDHGRVWLRDVALPDRRIGEMDVAISCAAICGSDLHTVLGHRAAPELVALGHEGIGIVIDLDADTVDARGVPLHVGDKVALSMISSCGSCDRCRAGLSMKCQQGQKYGHDSIERAPFATGMIADRVRLTAGVPVVRVPDDADDALLVSAGCAAATAAAVVAVAAPRPAQSALVFGAGAVGFFCAAMLGTAGCRVVVRDPSPERLALLRTTGACVEEGEGVEYAIVVEASGNAKAFADAFAAVEIGGQLVAAGSVSPGATTAVLDPALLVTRRVRLTGVHNYTTAEFVQAVDWLQTHGERAGVLRLTSPVWPLDRVEEAFAEMERGNFARVLVSPEA